MRENMAMSSLLLLLLAAGASADLPVECLYEDVRGSWTLWETARDGDHTLTCGGVTDDQFQHQTTVELQYPNIAEDQHGNQGTWTMIYNQGFEVRVAGRSFFAFSAFHQTGNETVSECDRTSTGWSRDVTVRNWACYRARKLTAVAPRVRARRPLLSSSPHPYRPDPTLVERINAQQSRWSAAEYPQFEGALTVGGVYRMRGGQRAIPKETFPEHRPASPHTKLYASMLPKTFDWRNVSGVNYVRPVKNQGECGSCYAFASIGALEAQLLIHSGAADATDLSAEDIVGCSRLSQGCDGGFPYIVAGRYAQDQGLVPLQCVPYDISPQCNHNRDACRKIYTTDYHYVGGYFGGCNEEEMRLALVNNGPLPVGIEVYDDFMQYKGGVYHHTELQHKFTPFETTNHAVLVVGYGETEDGEKYWIIQNSWGPEWGLEGYVWVRRGVDEIGVESTTLQVTAYP